MPVGEKAPRSQRESVQRWEVGPAAKALFDATYEVIKRHSQAFDALMQAHLAPRVVYNFGVKEEKSHDQRFEIQVGDTRWEISGTLINFKPGTPPDKKQELSLKKIDPTKHVTTYLEGYRVDFSKGYKTDPNAQDVYYGDIEYTYKDGSKSHSTQSALDKSHDLLEEFSSADTAIKTHPFRGRIRAWRNRRKPGTLQK